MGDLKVGETFKDACFITVLATGAPATLLADVTCTIIDELGNRNAGTVVEISDGWYECTDFAPDAAGNWKTEWSKTADPEDYVFHYPYKEFKVGGGEVTDIRTDVTTAITDIGNVAAELAVPAANAVANGTVSDVVGNKADVPKWFFTDTQSLMALAKAGTHTGGGISYAGTCDAGMAPSLTVIACAQLAGFGDDFFNTDYVMKIALNDNSHGASPEADAARDITDYDTATGTFTTAAFNNNVEANDKIVVSKRSFYTTDHIALLSTPGTNSLAFRLSQFVADGDGDFATGTPLPSNTSLYDVLKRVVCHMDFWSDNDDDITLTTVATADFNLPNCVVAGIPTGATFLRVVAMLKFALARDTSTADNAINGATSLNVDATNDYASLVTAINIADNSWSVDVSTSPDRCGDAMVGDNDIKAEVTANGTYYGQLTNIACDGNNLLLKDFAWGLRVYFTL